MTHIVIFFSLSFSGVINHAANEDENRLEAQKEEGARWGKPLIYKTVNKMKN